MLLCKLDKRHGNTDGLRLLSSFQCAPSSVQRNEAELDCFCPERRCNGGRPCSTCVTAGRGIEGCTYHYARGPSPTDGVEGGSDSASSASRPPRFFANSPSGNALLWQGPSSSLTFFELVQASIMGSNIGFPEMSQARAVVPKQRTAPPDDEELWSLPDDAGETLREDHSQAFFSMTCLHLHEPSFWSEVDDMIAELQEGVHARPLLLAYCNLVLALGRLNRQTHWGDEIDPEAQAMYDKAMHLLDIEEATNGSHSVMFVNTLLLQAAYETATAPTIEMGEASALSRAASYTLSLGLHVEPQMGRFDPIDAELRRRAFWVTRNWALHHAAFTGSLNAFFLVRPTVESPSDFSDQVETTTCLQHLQWASKLGTLGSDVIRNLYHDDGPRDLSKDLKVMLQLEERLQDWKDQLPPFFRIDDSTCLLQSSVQSLRLRYCFIRLLLMRPSLTRLLTRRPVAFSANLESLVWQSAERLCLEAAIDLVEAACSVMPMYRYHSLFRTDYIFVAATVFLVARWHHSFPSFEVMWDKALGVIRSRLPVVADRLDLLADHLEHRLPASPMALSPENSSSTPSTSSGISGLGES